MASGKVHALIGLMIFFIFALVLFMFATDLGLTENIFESTLILATGLFALVFSVLGSILPDIDHRRSNIYKQTRNFLCVLTALILFSTALMHTDDLATAALAAVAGFVITFVAITLFKPRHRGFTHTLRAAILYGLVAVTIYYFSFEKIAQYSGTIPDESVMVLFSTMIFLVSFTAYFSHNAVDMEFKF